jgi:hypothetical protein
MASRATMYRGRAADCLAMAESARNRASKETYLELATQWARLADRLEDEQISPLSGERSDKPQTRS